MDDQKGQTDKYELAAQYIQSMQNGTPAGMIEAPKPQCTSVAEIAGDKPHSIEVATEPLSGRLGAISNTNSKQDAAAVDQRNPGQNNIDQSMKQDIDGDGLVDGLDKKFQTRAEIAREMAEKKAKRARSWLAKDIERSLKERSAVKNLLNPGSQMSDRDVKNSAFTGQSKAKGPGEIDFSGFDSDKRDRVGGILANE
ncbi:MAG: hypothetical protein LBB15_01635 [Puniceicoccales bacterium]|nr:hypothetical protein [Puniceicoccales bacterium]